MPMNMIQFQKGLPLPEFLDLYGTEAKCRRALYRWRWPSGFRCPMCDARHRSSFRRGGQILYQCRACHHQTTLISGTLLASTKLPLTTWMLAIYLLTSTKTNLAALELKRHLGVCYRTAWRLKHKIMQAMDEQEKSRKLNGFVQIDDAYLGGERNGGKRGRGSENKQAFVIAVSTDGQLQHPTLCRDRARSRLRQRLAGRLGRAAYGTGCRGVHRWPRLLSANRDRWSCAHRVANRRRSRRHRGRWRAMVIDGTCQRPVGWRASGGHGFRCQKSPEIGGFLSIFE